MPAVLPMVDSSSSGTFPAGWSTQATPATAIQRFGMQQDSQDQNLVLARDSRRSMYRTARLKAIGPRIKHLLSS